MVMRADASGDKRRDAGRQKVDEGQCVAVRHRAEAFIKSRHPHRKKERRAGKKEPAGEEIAPNMEILSLSNRAIWDRGKKCKEARACRRTRHAVARV